MQGAIRESAKRQASLYDLGIKGCTWKAVSIVELWLTNGPQEKGEQVDDLVPWYFSIDHFIRLSAFQDLLITK